MTEEEIWKPVVGYEGAYEVSSLGRVRSRRRASLYQSLHRDGYIHVKLCLAGDAKSIFVHRLVASAFVSNPLNLGEVDHIDGCKTNNTFNNLRWVTRSENMLYAARLGRLRCPDNRGSRHGMAKLTEDDVANIRTGYRGWKQQDVADRFGVDRKTIGDILARKRWAHV